MERFLIDCSIRLALLVLGAWLLARALRLGAPSLQHRLFAAALAAALLLPVWTRFGPVVAAPVLPSVPRQEAVVPAAHVATPELGRPARPLALPANAPSLAPSLPAAAAAVPWEAIALAVYLAGAALMLARLILATRRVRALLRTSRPNGGFFVSTDCAAPVAAGWIRPVLLLPESFAEWPAAKLDAVLLHEREHIRRRDPLVQWLALLNRAVFWFHPLAWWLERRLAALAEDSCDAAVLARGVTPADYADYLIEIARSVTTSGARIQLAAMPFASANLPRRIRRILDASAAPSQSPARSIAAGVLCALLCFAFLACRPTRRDRSMAAQDRAALQESRDRKQQSQEHSAAISNAIRALTPVGAQALAAEVEAHPDDPDKLAELRGYYELHNDAKSLDAQALWFIEHHPEVRTVWEIGAKGPEVRPDWGYQPAWDTLTDRANYPHAIALWRTQLAKKWDNPYIYMNAAEFLSGPDNALAEQAIADGRRLFPSAALHWEIFLARHYAWELTGATGPLPPSRQALRRDAHGAPADDPDVRRIRAILLASTDIELLDRTIEQLQGPAFIDFSRSLCDRILSLQPDNLMAHRRRYAMDLRAAENATPASLTDSNRLLLLEVRLQQHAFGSAHGIDAPATARQLLDLAGRNPKDPAAGIAVFRANIVLGQSLLDRGDVPGAVRSLLAAADAPVSDSLRYMQLDMSLARALVDAGQRNAVAQFLDRCARFSAARQPLKNWAEEIRKGRNPNLFPNFNPRRIPAPSD